MASPTEPSMKSPAFATETMIEGIDRKASVALHMPPPQDTPMPVKLWSSSSEKITASPSLIAIARYPTDCRCLRRVASW